MMAESDRLMRSSDPVVICDYDPAWAVEFEQLRERLADALSGLAIAIEHIGSTAVPGLAAKPIVDIDIVVVSSEALPAAKEKLARIGYTFEGDLGIEGRFAFSPPPDEKRHHIYVCESKNPELRRHLAFRDLLRGNSQLAAEYAILKRHAAEHFRQDRPGYVAAKTTFIESALASLSAS
jgi:GrpB-like predicted nucleotidyltransferase (UPF0157 family)